MDRANEKVADNAWSKAVQDFARKQTINVEKILKFINKNM